MALIPIDNTHIVQAVVSDAEYLRSVIQWAKQRYAAYSLMLTGAVMDANGISAGDKTFILALISDLNRLIQLSSGTVPGNADDMVYNITQLLGLT